MAGNRMGALPIEALPRVAEQVSARWEVLRDDATSADEVATLARVIAGATAAELGGQAATGLPNAPVARRVHALFRTVLIEEIAGVAAELDGATVNSVFAALERVGAAMQPEWHQRLADRLSGPDAFDLVVEVAHDLRSPLTSILFLAETLQRGRSGAVTPLQERQLGLIYSAAFGLSSIASDVIELARGGDRLVGTDPLPFSVRDTMEGVRDIVFPIAEEKGLALRLVLPNPDARIGHPAALSRVLLNLTTNALKFTDEGHVEVAAHDLGGDRIRFSVQDTGRGIPPVGLAMLYEPFRRRQRDRDYAFSGSGLGLAICRKLVEAMGGELEVATGVVAGTTFSFVIALPPAVGLGGGMIE